MTQAHLMAKDYAKNKPIPTDPGLPSTQSKPYLMDSTIHEGQRKDNQLECAFRVIFPLKGKALPII